MLYLAGDNNLDDEMVWALKEVYRVGVPPGVSVTAQFDASARGGVRFYRPNQALDADGVFCVLHASEDSEQDSGDPDVLVRFVEASMEAAPAQHYMLILSGHGSGIIGDFLTDADSEKRRSLQPGSLSIPDLTLVFRRLRQRLEENEKIKFCEGREGRTTVLDVLGMDSCLMSMVEVCSEVAGEVGHIIGSEGFEPNAGWPYFRLLEQVPRLTADELKPEQLASRLARRYTTYYSDFVDAGLSVDLSVCDVSKPAMGRLHQAVAAFVDAYHVAAKPGADWIDDVIVLAHWRAQSYKGELYTDLADFFDLLAKECEKLAGIADDEARLRYTDLASLARSVVSAVNGGAGAQVVVFNDTSGPAFQFSKGLSVYFPWSLRDYEELYHSTAFAKITGWDTFLESHLLRTRRPLLEVKVVAPGAGQTLPASPDDEIIVKLEDLEGVGAGRPLARAGLAAAAAAGGPRVRTSAPSTKTSAPSTRTSAPSSKFAQGLGTLLQELPSRMKNPAIAVKPVIRLDPDLADAIEAVPDADASPDLRAFKKFLADRRAAAGPK